MMKALFFFFACCVRFSGRVPARQHRHHSTDNKHVGTQPVNHQVCVCVLAPPLSV